MNKQTKTNPKKEFERVKKWKKTMRRIKNAEAVDELFSAMRKPFDVFVESIYLK